MVQLVQMEVSDDASTPTFADNARRQSGHHEQPEQFHFLAQGVQCGDNAFFIHDCHKSFMFRRQSNLLTRPSFVKHISQSIEIIRGMPETRA
jgi:hypothetical protein